MGSSQEIRLRDSVFKTYMQLYNVPVAVIAIQGGPNTLTTIYEARARIELASLGNDAGFIGAAGMTRGR